MPRPSSTMKLRSNKTWIRDLPDTQTAHLLGDLPVGHNPATGFPQQHKRSKHLGSGSQAIVRAWKHKDMGTMIVVKTFRDSSYKAPAEAELLKALPPHRSIVTMLGYVPQSASSEGHAVIFEHCKFGDLFTMEGVLSQRGKLAHCEAFMWAIFSQLLEALAFLHEGIGRPDPKSPGRWRPVVHRDIKKENILVTHLPSYCEPSSIKIKLGDFGLATYYDYRHARMPAYWGTMDMWPPEQTWEKPDARPAGDIWAIGSIVHELAHGFPPIVDPLVTREIWEREQRPPPTRGESDGFWFAKSKRWPLPINVDPQEHAEDRRRAPATIKYSDHLNKCMMAALNMSMKKRATAGKLLTMIEQEYGAYTSDAVEEAP